MRTLILILILGLSACHSNSIDSVSSTATDTVAVATASPTSTNATKVRKISQIATGLTFAGTASLVGDSQGNVFYPDTNHFLIWKIDSFGNQSVFAGSSDGNVNGTGTQAQFSRPYLITIDKSDNLFVWDYGNYNIRKITPSGIVTTFKSIPSGNLALGMTVDSNGNIYYTETVASGWTSTHTIKKISSAGIISTIAGSGSQGLVNGNGTSASFNNPQSLVVDSSGNLYVADIGNFVIRKIDPAQNVTTFSGNGIQGHQDGNATEAEFYFYQTEGYLAIDSSDHLYIADMAGSTGYIRQIASDGSVTNLCGNGSGSMNQGNCDQTGIWGGALAINPNGTIYLMFGTDLDSIE